MQFRESETREDYRKKASSTRMTVWERKAEMVGNKKGLR